MPRTSIRPPARIPAIALAAFLILPLSAEAQTRGRAADSLPTIETKTAGMEKLDGYFPLYWDAANGALYMEIARFDTELLHMSGLAGALGSNDIGLDRGLVLGSEIVEFRRVGRKVLMIEPNLRFRSSSENPAEVAAVRDAFAPSVLWGFTVAAATGDRVLVDVTDYLLHDDDNIGNRLRPGQYGVDASRSAVYRPMVMDFPKNTEMEAALTFTRRPGAQGGPGGSGGGGFGAGRGFFEGVGSVAASADAATLRVHHSFIELPDTAGYTPREYDPRSGYFDFSFEDYSAPLGQPTTKRFITRHRLHKKNPGAAMSDPVQPIVYYLDPGVPEPVRSALLEGARWWNQAFEAAGYRNAFRVELRPDSISPFDIRYNVINWVHRSTRGWSYGASVIDPRTGEIIKGVVSLGSLRIRQDYLIAQGLLSPFVKGDEPAPELERWALARIRQLAAHEVGHTLGFAHNYYDSKAGRISVMDYPAPLVTLKTDGSLDYSSVYAVGIGEWDKVAITWGYQDFPRGTDEHKALDKILDDAWQKDLRFLSNQDIETTPTADQWSNGTDPAAQLDLEMAVRRAALARFGEHAIRLGMPMATIEEALVPLYLHQRYQVDAAVTALGGLDYFYALRGDGHTPWTPVPAAEQRAVLKSLLATLDPGVLAVPETVLRAIPPRPMGYGRDRELFPRYTGMAFDAITPAVSAARITVDDVFDPTRAARLVEQHARDASLPGLGEVIDTILSFTAHYRPTNGYQAEIRRAVERVEVDGLMRLAASAQMPQVRAIAILRLARMRDAAKAWSGSDDADSAHYALLARDVTHFLEHPDQAVPSTGVEPPPGAPIGESSLDWLRRTAPAWLWEEPQ
jgi:hypothetical protein